MAVTFKKLTYGQDWAVYKNGLHVNSLTRPYGDKAAKYRLALGKDHGFTLGEMKGIELKLKELNDDLEKSQR